MEQAMISRAIDWLADTLMVLALCTAVLAGTVVELEKAGGAPVVGGVRIVLDNGRE